MTHGGLGDMLCDTNRLDVFDPAGGGAGANIIGSGAALAPAPIPLPATGWLLIAALAGLAWQRGIGQAKL